MPYRSKQQARFIHTKANAGVLWASKFVAESAGQRLKPLPRKVKRISSRKRGAG